MSSSPETGTIAVSADFPGTELQILDDDRAVVARGIDRIESRTIEVGIYTVRALLGTNHTDKVVVVRPGQTQRVTVEAPAIVAAMPVNGTAMTHEYHQAAAEKFSRSEKLAIGAPSQGPPAELFLMAREWNRSSSSRRRPRPERMGGNLVLCHPGGKTMFEYKQLGTHEWGDDNCTAKTFILPPGFVRLCAIDGAAGYELPLYTAGGWQTQAYFLASGEDGNVVASDLAQASLTMRRIDRGFAPGDFDGRAIEAARSALEGSAGGIPDEILEGFLWEKFENPMLGLLAAHAMQRRGLLRPAMLDTVANNLAALIGPIPDVIALLLEANPNAQVPPVHTPPMLRASWALLLDHSAKRRDLIPRDSFAARIAKRVVGSGAWMVWLRPEPESTGLEALPAPGGLEAMGARRPIKTQEDVQMAVRWLGLPASLLEID